RHVDFKHRPSTFHLRVCPPHLSHTSPTPTIWKAVPLSPPPSCVPVNPERDLRWAIDYSYKVKPVREEPFPNRSIRQTIYILTSSVYFYMTPNVQISVYFLPQRQMYSKAYYPYRTQACPLS